MRRAENQIIENKEVKGEAGAGMEKIKKILNMKVDPDMCMKTISRGQNVTIKMCCIPAFAQVEN